MQLELGGRRVWGDAPPPPQTSPLSNCGQRLFLPEAGGGKEWGCLSDFHPLLHEGVAAASQLTTSGKVNRSSPATGHSSFSS